MSLVKKKLFWLPPNGVDVWQQIVKKKNGEEYEKRRVDPVEAGLYKITEPGIFFVRDLETEEEIPIEISFNPDNLKKAA